MLEPRNMHDYQVRAVNHQLAHPFSFIWLFMGAGKTVITETTIAELIRQGYIRGALVCGPLRVIQSVWAQEAKKWSHLRHLRFSLIHGNPQQRLRAITKPADIYLINYENLVWLKAQLDHYYVNRGTELPFDMLVLDESTKLKTVSTKRMKAIVPLLRYFKFRTGLTGTPASNGLEDLFGQFLVIDGGQRLGTSLNDYLKAYFTPEGYGGYKNRVTPEGEQEIHRRVADIVLEMRQEEYLKLPDLIVNDIYVDLPSRLRRMYDQMERELFVELDDGAELEVANEAAKFNKLLQMSNGAVYTDTETKTWSPIHEQKLDALESIIEEAGGSPVLVAYNYRPDAHRILQRFPFAKNITDLSGDEFNETLEAWRAGDERMLIGHPASMGHGIDGLQDSCNTMVWFGLNWSLELTLQFNARIHRQGQTLPVICHRILTTNTLDDAVHDALSDKTHTQDRLRRAVDLYRKRKEGREAA